MNSVLVPSTPQRSTWQRFIHYLFDEEGDHQSPVIMILILFNAFVLFLHSFPDLKAYHFAFELVDHSITLFFIIELLVKIRMQGWRRYFSQSWHKMDFALVLFSAPSLLLLLHQFEGLIPNTEFLLILRTLRIL
ncbi:MAG: ion transporter, partial [Verrucomicrobia bacterium]|nr:ion transporter [Cytophagales bacterium]